MAAKAEKKAEMVVTAPLVAAKYDNGVQVYLYRGASVDGLPEGELSRLIDLEMVGENPDAVPGVAAPFV